MSTIKAVIRQTKVGVNQAIYKLFIRPVGTIEVGGGGGAGGGPVDWADVQNKPTTFPAAVHAHAIADVTGLQGALDAKAPAGHDHEIAGVNGLQGALDAKQASLGFTPQDAAQKGVAGGYASLDETGKVPAVQLPSFVDDVVAVASFAALPATGEAGKIYVTENDGKVFRWSGSGYVEISPSPGSTDAVPEGAGNLYFTEARARGAALTGYAVAGVYSAIAAGDTILQAFGKIGKRLADLAAVAFSGSASDLTAGTLPEARFGDASHGNRSGGLLHALATTGAAGFMSAADKTKLDGVASGATANATDAALRDRASHTGTQDATTITGTKTASFISDFAAAVAALITGKQDSLVSGTSIKTINGSTILGAGNLVVSAEPKGDRTYMLFMPAGGTVVTNIGLNITTAGTAAALNPGTGQRLFRMKRLSYRITTAAATAVASWRHATAQLTIGGGQSWEGGFQGVMQGGPDTGVAANASHRFFMGLGDTSAPTDVNPSTLLRIAGIGYDAADTQVQFMHNDGSGTATKIALGASFPKPNADSSFAYRLRLSSPPGPTQSLSYEVENLVNGAIVTGTITTDLPAVGDFITPKLYTSVGGVSAVTGVMIGPMEFEAGDIA